MMKKMMLLIAVIQIAALSACGNAVSVTPVETDTAQTEQTKSVEEDITMAEEAVQDTEETMQDNEGNGMAESVPARDSRVLIAYFSQPTQVDTSDLDAVSGASVVVRDGETAGSTTEYAARIIQETVGGNLFRIETTDEYTTDYDELVAQARAEKEENARPEFTGHIEIPEQYDTIILGYPSWIMDLPMPVYSFLEEYDFGAKTIIPFVTHGGSGFGSTREAILELQPGAYVSDNGLSLARDDVSGGEEEIRQWAESLNLNAGKQRPHSRYTISDSGRL